MTTTLKAPAPTRPVKVNGPTDGDLAIMWRLAVMKFESRTSREPATREDWAAITQDYSRITAKQRGSLAHVIRERCAEQPGGT